MAIFNAPMDLENHEEKAVKTAIEMQEAIKELNKELPHEIAIGVGTQSGYAVIGNMGSSTRFDYSAIGDACLLYTSPSPRDGLLSRMPSSA